MNKVNLVPLKKTTMRPAVVNNISGSKVSRSAHRTPGLSDPSLDSTTSAFPQPRFAYDFSRVPVHSPAQTLIQAKLRIGRPNDIYEQEADRVADQVMRMPEPKVQRQCPKCEEELQRKPVEEEEDRLQNKPIAEQITPLVQRQVKLEEEEELIQTKKAGNVTPEVTPAISSSIQSLQGGGRPLSRSERSFFEPRFRADFSGVRVHNDTQAASVARSVNARAFTFGHNVVFGSGEYSPGASSGRQLLAHELTHVVQQNGGPTFISAGKNSENTIPNFKELSTVSQKIPRLPRHDKPHVLQSSAPNAIIQCWPIDENIDQRWQSNAFWWFLDAIYREGLLEPSRLEEAGVEPFPDPSDMSSEERGVEISLASIQPGLQSPSSEMLRGLLSTPGARPAPLPSGGTAAASGGTAAATGETAAVTGGTAAAGIGPWAAPVLAFLIVTLYPWRTQPRWFDVRNPVTGEYYRVISEVSYLTRLNPTQLQYLQRLYPDFAPPFVPIPNPAPRTNPAPRRRRRQDCSWMHVPLEDDSLLPLTNIRRGSIGGYGRVAESYIFDDYQSRGRPPLDHFMDRPGAPQFRNWFGLTDSVYRHYFSQYGEHANVINQVRVQFGAAKPDIVNTIGKQYYEIKNDSGRGVGDGERELGNYEVAFDELNLAWMEELRYFEGIEHHVRHWAPESIEPRLYQRGTPFALESIHILPPEVMGGMPGWRLRVNPVGEHPHAGGTTTTGLITYYYEYCFPTVGSIPVNE